MSIPKDYTPFTFTTSFDELEKSELQVQDEEKRRLEEEEKERLRLEEELRNNPPPPPPPTFSEEELLEAKNQAYEEGRQAGINETLAGIENESKTTLDTLIGLFAVLQDRQSLANESQAAALSKISFEVIRKILPTYIQEYGFKEVETLIYSSLLQLDGKGKVKITLPAASLEQTKKQLQYIIDASGFEGTIVFLPDPHIGASDVKLDWGHGSTERHVSNALSEMEKIVENFVQNHFDAEENTGEALTITKSYPIETQHPAARTEITPETPSIETPTNGQEIAENNPDTAKEI